MAHTSTSKTIGTAIDKIAFVSSGSAEAEAATRTLRNQYGETPLKDAEVVVALGGDGLMLQTLHDVMKIGTPVYGMNLGTIGFLMNDFGIDGLKERLAAAGPTNIHPLTMDVLDINGKKYQALALNEVSLFRSTYQAAKIKIIIDGKTRLEQLICDGVLIATTAGSTAYNLSAHGPILPIDSSVLALTPISPFRPRRWRGAILRNSAVVTFVTDESDKRPVSAVADNVEFKNVAEVIVREDRSHKVTMLFDPGHGLEERVLNEQFQY